MMGAESVPGSRTQEVDTVLQTSALPPLSVLRAALVLMLLSGACESSPEHALADASGSDTHSPGSALVDDGFFSGPAIGFQVEGGKVVRVVFYDLACDGTRPDTGEACHARLDGAIVPDPPVEMHPTGFDYTDHDMMWLHAEFDDPQHARGTLNALDAESRCCRFEVEWNATWSSSEDNGSVDCDPADFGGGTLSIGAVLDGQFTSIEAGDTLLAIPGFQGAVMVVAALRWDGTAPPKLSPSLAIHLPVTGVTAEVAAVNDPFIWQEPAQSWQWRDIWLVLIGPDGVALDPFSEATIALLDDQPAMLTARLIGSCGVVAEQALPIYIDTWLAKR